jgi:hypothetical protein
VSDLQVDVDATLYGDNAGTPVPVAVTATGELAVEITNDVGNPLPVTVQTSEANGTATGTLSAAGQAVTLVLPAAASAAEIQLTGDLVGTVVFESSGDGGATYNPRVYRGAGILNVLETGTSTFPSEWRGNVAAMTHVRVRCTARTSGSLNVTIVTARGAGAVFLNAAVPIGGVSVGNTATTNVPTASSYTGVWERMTHVASINIAATANAAGLLRAQFSRDGSTVFQEVTYAIAAGTPLNRIIPPRTEFFRIVYDNLGGATAALEVETTYRAVGMQLPVLGAYDDVPSSALGAVSKVIVEPNRSATSIVRTVTSTSGRVDLNTAGRKSILLRARNFAQANDLLYVGFTNPMTVGAGVELAQRESLQLDLAAGVAVYAIGTRAAGNPLEVVELVDA